MRSQTSANIIQIFQNTYHVIYISRSGVERSFCTSCTCLVFQQRHIQNPFKYLRWSVFVYPVNDFKVLTVYTKVLHLKCLKGFWVRLCSGAGNVLCNYNKYLMGYFKFLHGSRIICLSLNISEKLHWQYVFEKLEKAETHRLHLC